MPNWKLHNDWAVKLGISRQVANLVNKREDLPKIPFCDDKSLQKFKEQLPDTQPTYDEMSKMGSEYLRAWILHLLIDEMEDICEYIIADKGADDNSDLYKETKDMFCNNALLRLTPDDINNFIFNNMDDLFGDVIESFVKPFASVASSKEERK